MGEFYTMKIAGLERQLPICPLNDKVSIAGFIIFGDVELTVAVSKELLKKVNEFDVILTPEAKSIPLAYEMSRQSGKPYVVARKGLKAYMKEPISVEVTSITTHNKQHLYLGLDEVNLMKGKKVLIVDDVISTGESLRAIEELVHKAGGEICGRMTVLAEGDAQSREDLIYLEKLPLFDRDGNVIA